MKSKHSQSAIEAVENKKMRLLHGIVKMKGEGKYDLKLPTLNLVGKYGIVKSEYKTTCIVGVPLPEFNYMACVCVPLNQVEEVYDYFYWMGNQMEFHEKLKKVDKELYDTVHKRRDDKLFSDEEWERKGWETISENINEEIEGGSPQHSSSELGRKKNDTKHYKTISNKRSNDSAVSKEDYRKMDIRDQLMALVRDY